MSYKKRLPQAENESILKNELIYLEEQAACQEGIDMVPLRHVAI